LKLHVKVFTKPVTSSNREGWIVDDRGASHEMTAIKR
jgi:hypothetical protein